MKHHVECLAPAEKSIFIFQIQISLAVGVLTANEIISVFVI